VNQRNLLLLLIYLSISIILGACKPSQAELDAQATQIAADVYSTQTAQAPTATKTLIPSPTNTPTITPTITPTLPPTNTPTITPTPLPDISGVGLTLKDLPPGFEEIPPEEFGLSKEDMSDDEFFVENIFLFMQVEPIEFIMGFTILIPSKLDQLSFDVALTQPELFMDSFMMAFDLGDVNDLKELPDLAIYGDTSAGFTLAADTGLGMVMRMDMAVIRRDFAGAILIIMYIDGETPVVTIDEIASKMDERLIEVLPPSQ
jgi:hypothetical protein